jgi:hypothetical protein
VGVCVCVVMTFRECMPSRSELTSPTDSCRMRCGVSGQVHSDLMDTTLRMDALHACMHAWHDDSHTVQYGRNPVGRGDQLPYLRNNQARRLSESRITHSHSHSRVLYSTVCRIEVYIPYVQFHARE